MEDNIVEQTAVDEIEQADPLAELSKQVKTLQKSLSNQGYELGELREFKRASQVNAKKEDPVDFYTDPEKAMEQRIANNPKLQEIDNLTAQLKQQAMLGELKSEHPDFKEVLADDNFLSWVDASKKRSEMFKDADQRYDIDAANELFGTWKELQSIKKTGEAEATVKNGQERALKSARVDTGNSSVSNKKIYASIDLQRLRTSDPTAYKALNPSKLYAEGRVK